MLWLQLIAKQHSRPTAERTARTSEEEKERLERKVGQLVVEVDWLKKKSKELGIDP
jgi:hypothetical protein